MCKCRDVNTLIVKGKTKRIGRGRPGKTADWKKAIVTLEPDAKADALEGNLRRSVTES